MLPLRYLLGLSFIRVDISVFSQKTNKGKSLSNTLSSPFLLPKNPNPRFQNQILAERGLEFSTSHGYSPRSRHHLLHLQIHHHPTLTFLRRFLIPREPPPHPLPQHPRHPSLLLFHLLPILNHRLSLFNPLTPVMSWG